LMAQVAKSTREATALYPTSAILHAQLAEASASLGQIDEAARSAASALRLDGLTPHDDKKLPEAVRKRLEQELPRWLERRKEREKAAEKAKEKPAQPEPAK